MATKIQDGATATGNGTAITLLESAEGQEIRFMVDGITTATVTYEVSPDNGTTWVASGTTSTSDGYVDLGKVIATTIRARISAYTSGTINVWYLGIGGTTVTDS